MGHSSLGIMSDTTALTSTPEAEVCLFVNQE